MLPRIQSLSKLLPSQKSLAKENVATRQKGNRSKTPAKRPDEIGHTFYFDIGFGTTNAIGGIRYTLTIIDQEGRHLYTYGLCNLKETSLAHVMNQFIKEIGGKPARKLEIKN